MHKHKYRRGKRFAGLFLSAALVMTGIPVQAAEFTAPSAETDLFSSGVADAYTGGSGTGTSSSVSSFYKGESSEPAADSTPTVTPADEPGETPSVTPTPSAAQEGTLTVTPEATPSVTPSEAPEVSPTVTPEMTPAVTPTVTPTETPSITPTPTINPEEEIMLRFIDGDGNECDNLSTVLDWGETLILPHVPDETAPDQWKLEKDEKLNDSITLNGGEIMTLKKGESWNVFINKGVLTFYMPKKCTLSLYNNSGTAVFRGLKLKVYETNSVTLPNPSGTKYINYGWTDVKGSTDVKYALNSEYKVTKDQSLYIVRRNIADSSCQIRISGTGMVFE